MSNVHYNQFAMTIADAIEYAKNKGVIRLNNETDKWNGQSVQIKGKELINFGTCGYLGLETDIRLINRAKQYIDEYGPQFSTSRTYLTSNQIERLEALLSQLFCSSPTLIFSSTSLAHIGILPSIINQNDLVILDKDTHFSIQNATQLLHAKKISVQMIKHSNMAMLEKKILKSKNSCQKIWYLIDGIYSMHGDLAPVETINDLMSKYTQLHLYIDDAHGLGWCGKNGTGTIFEKIVHKERIVFTASMAKAFGSSGGIAVFPNKEDYTKVKTFGGPLSYSHSLTPPQIGASMATCEIFLSDELEFIQKELADKIKYCNSLLEAYEIPILSAPISPIKFILIGTLENGCTMVKKIHQNGYYINVAMFPAVPLNQTGIRFTITQHLNKQQIKGFVETLARNYFAIIPKGSQRQHIPGKADSTSDSAGARTGQ